MGIFQYTFMQYAFISGVIIGILCPLIGIFLVLRNLSLIADGIAHLSFGGLALGIVLGLNPSLALLISSIIGGLGIDYVSRKTRLYGDTATAIFLSTGLALGIVIISFFKGMNININSYLFGSILALTRGDLVLTIIIGILGILSMYLMYNVLFYISFDEESAKASGLPAERVNILFILTSAITIAISIRISGILLVSALTVLPVATAIEVSNSFKMTTIFSMLIGVFSIFIGLLFSYYFNVASGGVIILVNVFIFVLSLLVKRLPRFFNHKMHNEKSY
ncbi:MAG: metal ABC transporter permease [bacterium]